MSDYLWDKTGEADEEAERLEELLGGFRYQPRAFELPAEAVRHAPPARTARRRSWHAFAAAAAAVLMLLAGAWLLTLRRVEQSAQTAGRESRVTPSPEVAKETPAPEQKAATAGGHDGSDDRLAGVPATGPSPRKAERIRVPERHPSRPSTQAAGAAAASGRRREPAQAHTPRGASPDELAAVPTRGERREAKEQLMYALRLTSAKLGEVQKKISGEEDAKPSPVERNETR